MLLPLSKFTRTLIGLALSAAAGLAGATPTPCRVPGISSEAQCGFVKRPLDPAKPGSTQIEVHYLVVPALARNKLPDPVLFLAGGPGQSAIKLAPRVMGRFARVLNRRDMVFVDQRGTGKSAPLECPDEDALNLSLKDLLDPEQQTARLEQCRAKLQALPYGDLRQFTTTIAMQDIDAIRADLGVERWNVIGGSYGTRAGLEYLRQFPQHVRRLVIDGVAPPDMVLPATMSLDAQAALDAEFAACAKDKDCAARYPKLRDEWTTLLRSLPHAVSVYDPRSGRQQEFKLEREILLSLVRSALYSPALTSALPAAIHAAALGQFDSLFGVASGLGGGGKGPEIAAGMHYSVICAEDAPRMSDSAESAGADFGNIMAQHYSQICKSWPRGAVPAAFYTVPAAKSPVLLLSGGVDPVTPPRHADRVAKALGPMAQQVVVPQSGHGVMAIGCMSDVIYRFIDAKEDAKALPVDAACATAIPRPPAFVPPGLKLSQGDAP